MRGADVTQENMFTYVTLGDLVPVDHPLRPIREILNTALREMDKLFAKMYSEFGRESIPPEQLLRGLILQSLYGLRSERLLCEQLGYNMLFRWFVGLSLDKGAVGALHVHQEPRPTDRARCDARFVRPRDRAGAGERPALLGALLGGRHAHPGLGVAQELCAEGRSGTAQLG